MLSENLRSYVHLFMDALQKAKEMVTKGKKRKISDVKREITFEKTGYIQGVQKTWTK